MSEAPVRTTLPPLSERVVERRVGGVRLLMLPTPVESVVSLRGSLRTYPDLAVGDDLLQDLAVAMLDKGTQKRDRFAVARLMDDRGAQLHFRGAGERVGWHGRALREDLPEVLSLLGEQLREPLFDAAEFAKAKAQAAASLQRSLDSTGSQASAALSRLLYAPTHANFTPPFEAELARLESIELDDVRGYHARHFGARELVVVLVGDLDPDDAARHVEDALGDWAPPSAGVPGTGGRASVEQDRLEIPMDDRENIDVRLGQVVPVRRDDDDFLPLHVGTYILGGNFSARLMQVVRDEMGLTYGIGARLAGVTVDHEGHFLVSVTLSGDKLDEGIAATREQVRRWVEAGVTADEVADKQTTITGSFQVQMGTTGGLAASLQVNAERGFDVGYLDRFPALVEAVDPASVNEVVRRCIDPAALRLALAGTLPG